MISGLNKRSVSLVGNKKTSPEIERVLQASGEPDTSAGLRTVEGAVDVFRNSIIEGMKNTETMVLENLPKDLADLKYVRD